MFMQIIALGLTVSRSGIGAICVALFVFSILSIRYKDKRFFVLKFKEISILAILTLCTLAVVYMADDSRMVGRLKNIAQDPSAQARVESWTKAADTITTTVAKKSNTLMGVGYNMIGFVRGTTDQSISFGVDSTLMLIVLTTGVIGILLYLLYVFKTLIDIIHIRNIDNFYTANAIVAIFIASLAASFFNNLLFYPLWFFPFLLISNYFIVYYKNDKFIR